MRLWTCTWRILTVLLLGCTLLVAAPRPALADTRDTVDSWQFTMVIAKDGSLRVTEKLVYRFGQNSGRHGIIRQLVTREPWDEEQDASYSITNVEVNSPDASAHFTTTIKGAGRNRTLEVRIGSADRTITTPTATYVISYTVRGALRDSAGFPELYWDILSAEAPDASEVNVSVTAPGGVQDAKCWNGSLKATDPCSKAEIEGTKGIYQVNRRANGQIMTIGAKLVKGQVTNTSPRLEPRATSPVDYAPGPRAALGALVTTGLAGLVGWSVVRRKGRDLRFLDVPPGVIPSGGSSGRVGPAKNPEIPVAFSPPKVPVAEAGLLVDGQVDVRETTATLVDLAVRGALAMSQPSEGVLHLTLVDPSRVHAPHEAVLVDSLFAAASPRRGLRPTPGLTVELGQTGDMEHAHRELVASVTNQVASRGWFTDVPRTRMAASGGGLAGVVVFLFLVFGGGVLAWWPLLLAIAGPLLVIWLVQRALRRGQRTAVGRAVTDQIEGFEIYLRTAETEQLRFEEGEDIFSKYLPWAIIFGVAERWTKVCQPLVASGQLPAPTWYYGSSMDWYIINSMLNDLTRVSTPAPPPDTGLSGTGFGAGSAFGGGGGFSGGGGGGGSVSSW